MKHLARNLPRRKSPHQSEPAVVEGHRPHPPHDAEATPPGQRGETDRLPGGAGLNHRLAFGSRLLGETHTLSIDLVRHYVQADEMVHGRQPPPKPRFRNPEVEARSVYLRDKTVSEQAMQGLKPCMVEFEEDPGEQTGSRHHHEREGKQDLCLDTLPRPHLKTLVSSPRFRAFPTGSGRSGMRCRAGARRAFLRHPKE